MILNVITIDSAGIHWIKRENFDLDDFSYFMLEFAFSDLTVLQTLSGVLTTIYSPDNVANTTAI